MVIGGREVTVTVPIEAVSSDALIEVACAKADELEGDLVAWRVRELLEILRELLRRQRLPE